MSDIAILAKSFQYTFHLFCCNRRNITCICYITHRFNTI